jgi:hypothetical protein
MLSRFVGPLVAIVVASVAVPSARALDTRDLAGWWIAIDRAFPTLWERGDIVAMEELLIISPDGRAENRGMGFFAPDDCMPGEACTVTDAPLIATARLTLRGDLLTVSDRKESRGRINIKKADPALRRIAVTNTPAWTATLDGNFLILRAATGNATRALARIEPDRLRRLRAGLMFTEQSAARHWRCFFANATANDPAFTALSAGSRSAPSFLDDYLRVASYRATLATLGSMPTADHPDAQRRALASGKAEIMLVETFPDIPAPKNHAEAQQLLAGAVLLCARARGLPPAEATAAATAALRATPVSVTATDGELAAYARVRRGAVSGSSDAEMKRLFCLE